MDDAAAVMADPYLTVGGRPASRAWGVVPWSGLWLIELDVPERVELSELGAAGAVEVTIGSTSFRGSVDPRRSGTFIDRTKVCVIAGAGGWRKDVAARGYHNDAGARRSQVAGDAARDVGEVLEVDTSAEDRQASGGILAVDFERLAGRASDVLERLYQDQPWWVDLEGTTRVGPRARAASSGVDVLDFDPREQVATLGLRGELDGCLPGAMLVDEARGVDAVIQDLEFEIASGVANVTALCVRPGDEPTRSRFLEESPPAALAGLYRYRVTRHVLERVDLQAVRAIAGLPDALLVPVHPGIAGGVAALEPGTIVLVQFVEGDPAFPVVTHFARKDEVRFLPLSLSLDATNLVELGKTAALTKLGSGSDVFATPSDAIGRVIRWGDTPTWVSPGPPAPILPVASTPVSRVGA